jgi:hypothetical protein
MMDDLKKRMLVELCITPATVVPATVGISLLMLATITGGAFALWGFVGVLIGAGMFMTNLLTNMDSIRERIVRQMQEEAERKQKERLDALDAKLVQDRDPRDQRALRNLRSLYDCFKSDLKNGKVKSATPDMLSQIDSLFEGCVCQLDKQHEIWETSTKVQGPLREKMLSQKEQLLAEVDRGVEGLAGVIAEIRALGLKSTAGEVDEVRKRLDRQLQVAKEVNQLVAGMEDLSRFEEYTK